MSFYTALTGLKGAQTDISTTSNNIANVGSNGFKKSRADFGDIFGSTPMQTKQVGVGTQTKSITQQFGQGNLTTSSNTLDMAVSGQGFFAMQTGGSTPQTVYTRNGAFNVDDTGFVVDSNGQFLLGYPVDDDGAVANKTLAGSNKLQLKAEYGAPTMTTTMTMGVNLNSKEPVLPADNIFDIKDPDTFTSSSAVTIFDKLGNPQSATVFYLKTQDQTNADPTFKYDTKLFVDGVEITPTLTWAVDPQKAELYIDKFGQQTTVPQDPAYILPGKAFPLYKADDLGPPADSTPAKLTGLPVNTYLDQNKTITITTDPLEFRSTVEWQKIQDPVPTLTGSTFWGKDFMLVDIDASGPTSIDIPPGTYTGTQLAAAVEVATKEAFGDDKKIKLVDNVDEKFTIDLKFSEGDGESSGLSSPIIVDLHSASGDFFSAVDAEAGMKRDTFLTHAQLKINEAMNAKIHEVGGQGARGIDTDQVDALHADGKMFKKITGTEISKTVVPGLGNGDIDPGTAGAQVRLDGNDIVAVVHKTGTGVIASGGGIATRYVAYSNDATGTEANKPAVKAYDHHATMVITNATTGKTGENPFFEVPITQFSTTPGVVRFMEFASTAARTVNTIGDFFGSKEIPVKGVTTVGATVGNYRITLDYDMKGVAFPTFVTAGGAQSRTVSVLGKPSEHIAAYFESTEGLVEGVNEAHYTNKIVVQEIGNSAKRTQLEATTTNAVVSLAFAGMQTANTASGTLASGAPLTDLGITTAGTLTTNWVDDRNPSIKIGYDEVQQRLTFDADNRQLGKGTGVGANTFTVYGPALGTGVTNSLGIQAFGNNKDISLTTDDKIIGDAFLASGPDVQVANKRFGMDVYFDTVNNKFEFSSGKTGETLAANSAVGVAANQSKSDIALGRYKLDQLGGRDATDLAAQVVHRLGKGGTPILGFPRQGSEGFTAPTGLESKAAIVTGKDALINMQKAFTVTDVGNENKFTVVVNGVSAFIELPQKNYTGVTMATALQDRINNMQHPTTGSPIGGVDVSYVVATNNLVFTSGTKGGSTTFKIEGDVRFGLKEIPLGIGVTATVKTPVQAKDADGRPLFVSPTGEITSQTDDFADNIVKDFFPLYLDNGELTFNKSGELVSPITKVTYEGLPNSDIEVDYSSATQFATAFSAQDVTQDGKGAGKLTNLEIDNLGNILAGYSNGTNVSLGKIILANFTNNAGLKQIGNSTFSATAASGAAQLGEATMDGFGNIMSGSLERSNVDITEELVNLITAQRNYQAAAKAMETTTSMTQTIINIRQ